MGRACQGGCEPRIEVFVQIQKKKFLGVEGGGGRGGGLGPGGQGGSERRIKVFVKIQKKKFFLGGGVSGRGVRWGVGSGRSGCMWTKN